jgi:hypothetical protein
MAHLMLMQLVEILGLRLGLNFLKTDAHIANVIKAILSSTNKIHSYFGLKIENCKWLSSEYLFFYCKNMPIMWHIS